MGDRRFADEFVTGFDDLLAGIDFPLQPIQTLERQAGTLFKR